MFERIDIVSMSLQHTEDRNFNDYPRIHGPPPYEIDYKPTTMSSSLFITAHLRTHIGTTPMSVKTVVATARPAQAGCDTSPNAGRTSELNLEMKLALRPSTMMVKRRTVAR